MAVGAYATLSATVGDVLAETETAKTFRLYTNGGDGAYALLTVEERAAWPVMWREGETVTAKAWNSSTLQTLVANAASDAGESQTQTLPSGGGLWTLVNSASGTAYIGVAWAVFSDGSVIGETADGVSFAIDSVANGPDRKTKNIELIPVAYSCDDWARDVTSAATLTFAPPGGGAATTLDLTGTGADRSFKFNTVGMWTVTLTMADGTTKIAYINVRGAGFIISLY